MSIFSPQLHHTASGTPYFREAGVALVAETAVGLHPSLAFLEGFDSSLGFGNYFDDLTFGNDGDDELADSDVLVKFAGQLCYMSFGPKRTWNKDASKYLENIKRQGHGSVLEHASFTLLFWGIDRTLTHELVRHRAGFAFSQVSQRYVGPKTLRFVMRPERVANQTDMGLLREQFCRAIDSAARGYRETIGGMEQVAADGHPAFQAESATERRKKIHQVARDLLPGCTEAPILVTGNVRAWRHFIEMRAHPKADTPIRDAAVKALTILRDAAPLCFEDYKIIDLDDGTRAAETEFRKV